MGTDWQVPGELTIRGETRPVTLDVEFLGTNQI
jgi:polyisoprenoid-binding protein YceI